MAHGDGLGIGSLDQSESGEQLEKSGVGEPREVSFGFGPRRVGEEGRRPYRVVFGRDRGGRVRLVLPGQVVEDVENAIPRRLGAQVLEEGHVPDLSRAEAAERVERPNRDGDRVQRTPRFRLEAVLGVSRRQAARRLRFSDPPVDTPGVAFDGGAGARAEPVELIFEFLVRISVEENFAVGTDGGRTEDFGEPSSRQSPAHLHLPQPILSGRIAGERESLLPRCGVDVGDAERVPLDRLRSLPDDECNQKGEHRIYDFAEAGRPDARRRPTGVTPS
ncbi:MAG: hypothetical protein SNJ61_11025 [Fimbriimonadaceae bacterium]